MYCKKKKKIQKEFETIGLTIRPEDKNVPKGRGHQFGLN